MSRKSSKPQPLPFFRKPLFAVEIRRQNRWWRLYTVNEGDTNTMTVTLDKSLGDVTAIRVRSLHKEG